jgi:HAE1 family hydrophobic/amphiphilic exporter-1
MTPNSGVQTVGELVNIQQTVGPPQLTRIDGHRTVSVNFEPPRT